MEIVETRGLPDHCTDLVVVQADGAARITPEFLNIICCFPLLLPDLVSVHNQFRL
jgi:hypothetical protein